MIQNVGLLGFFLFFFIWEDELLNSYVHKMNVIEIRILNLITGSTNIYIYIYCSGFKSRSVDFPTINLLIEEVSTEAQHIMSRGGVSLGEGAWKGQR